MKTATFSNSIQLANGVMMPRLGLGTWQSQDGAEVQNSVSAAIEEGYRHIDTAAIYRNELGVGKGIAMSGVDRVEIFLTSKVWNPDQGFAEDKVYKAGLFVFHPSSPPPIQPIAVPVADHLQIL